VWTLHGDLALPLLTTERELIAGDVLWTDVSITYRGYCSDFGRTWIVGREPTPRQQAQFHKWQEIMTAVLDVTQVGATAADLGRAATKANGGSRPWLPHFYLGHGIGVNPAEMPMIGTDLGDEFDENFVFEPGMVLVLEPVVWEDGTGGYRSEEIVVITEEGWMPLTDYPYDPYGN
jgi:Xaa-Pro dipeptidase